jgi:hypothetical protein
LPFANNLEKISLYCSRQHPCGGRNSRKLVEIVAKDIGAVVQNWGCARQLANLLAVGRNFLPFGLGFKSLSSVFWMLYLPQITLSNAPFVEDCVNVSG